MYEQARALLDELHRERLEYSEYRTLVDALNGLQDEVDRLKSVENWNQSVKSMMDSTVVRNEELLEENKRLIGAFEDAGLTAEQTLEILSAAAGGRLVVLPYKVGDTVYEIRGESIQEHEIQLAVVHDGNTFTFAYEGNGIFLPDWIDKGRSWFASRAEAEAMLDKYRFEEA